MLVVLKIPVLYLAAVVWWAVRADPAAQDGRDEVGVRAPLTPCGWDEWKRRRVTRHGRRPIRPSGARFAARVRTS
jgi:hypothetical protein